MNRQQQGLTLVEVLVAMTLIVVLLVPALQALNTGLTGTDVHANITSNHYRIVTRLETVLAESFGNLETAAAGPTVPSSYSDAAGPAERLLVYIARYDADNADGDDDPFTDPDEDILWVQVAVEGSTQRLASLAIR